ncbi:MAG: nitroreductase family protein [Azoarcus sp.]|nr:nitroreductase family protein [Azoarcus sp.]
MNSPGSALPVASPSAPPPLSADAIVRLYHERSKHRFEAYAAGPKMLDWDAQPAPFRHYTGAPAVFLTLLDEVVLADVDGTDPLAQVQSIPFDRQALPRRPQAPGLASIGVLLQLSLGITAWKTLGPDRWAVRANPSSGNLHPVEAWLITRGVPGLADGVHHYRADDHALECRALDIQPPPSSSSPSSAPQLRIALSTAMWREAWKYGERGFRYCQLDVGHAVGALAHAAALLGWPLAERRIGNRALAHRLGLDRDADYPTGRFPDLEREEAEILLTLSLDGGSADRTDDPAPDAVISNAATSRAATTPDAADALLEVGTVHWHGKASPLDPAPRHHWPLIQDVAIATRRPDSYRDTARRARPELDVPPRAPATDAADMSVPAVDVLLTRRSAQRFAASHWMTRPQFLALLEAISEQDMPGLTPGAPRLNAVLYIHRVETLDPGIYVLSADTDRTDGLPPFAAGGHAVSGLDHGPGLRLLRRFEPVELYRLTRSLHCHQDIAANACLALGLVAPFAPVVTRDPAAYRDLLRSAGLIGQSLYLRAEALGLRGTGIGCFFDDPVHKLLGIDGSDYQTLYHFTVGLPIDDARIETGPAYPASRRTSLLPAFPAPEPTP